MTPLKSAADAVKILAVYVSDSGDLDKFESDSEPSLSDPTVTGPYELTSGRTLNLFENPPAGRSSWVSKAMDVSDLNRIGIVLSGIGLHKATLGGGANPDLPFARFMSWLRGEFLELIPTIGSALEAGFDLAERIANADPDRNCLGPLFVFKRDLNGGDLILAALRANRSLEMEFSPEDSEPVNVTGTCGRPRYRARLRAILDERLEFDLGVTSSVKERSPEVTLSNVTSECAQPSPIRIWVARRETVCRLVPKTRFQALDYVFSIGDTEIRAEAADLAVTLPVTRLDPANPIEEETTRDETVRVRCRVDAQGHLEIRCPPTAGNFSLPVSVALRNQNDQARVHERRVHIVTEDVEGNAAYDAYSSCMAKRAERMIREILQIKQVVWEIPTDPRPVEAIRMMEQLKALHATTRTLTRAVSAIGRGRLDDRRT